MTFTATRILALATLPLALTACETMADVPTEQLAQARLTFANGLPAGTAQLVSNGNTVSLAVAVTGVEPGQHGFHLHAVGKCEAPGFTSAGGHLNPASRTHGHLSAGGKHLGDMPNLNVGANRTAAVNVDLAGTPDALMASLFDADGTAIVIHADPDDYTSDPTGNAGARVACGVLTRG